MEMTFPVAPPARRYAPASGRCHYGLWSEGSIPLLVCRPYSGLSIFFFWVVVTTLVAGGARRATEVATTHSEFHP